MINKKEQFNALLEMRYYSIQDSKGKTISEKSSEDDKIAAVLYNSADVVDGKLEHLRIKKVNKKALFLVDSGISEQYSITKDYLDKLEFYEDITLDKIVKYLKKKGVK